MSSLKIKRNAIFYAIVSGVIIGLLLSLSACFEKEKLTGSDLKSNTFTILDNIRDQKLALLTKYFSDVQKTALNIVSDNIMLESFYTMQNNFQHNNKYAADHNLELKIDMQYAEKYGDFYDILFVDSSGFIFHSIRQEWDYQRNL